MAVATLQCVWGLLCIILLNMQCRPHEAIWKFYLPSKCYSLPDVMLTSACVQVASDIIMFVLPQRIIWHLQMTWQKKLGISVIFGAGILSVHATPLINSLELTVPYYAVPPLPPASASPTPSASQTQQTQCI